MNKAQITLDGPAASGKSTIASLVAEKMGAFYINTGDMYRTLTRKVMDENIDVHTEANKIVDLLSRIDVNYRLASDGQYELVCDGVVVKSEDIRNPQVTTLVSHVAKIPEVRQWLVTRQRQSADLGLIVMEGRDIGTVVFPESKFKFYVTASPLVRAQRRLAQSGEVLEGATVEKVAAEIAERDELDMNRAVSPLKPAEDAILVDTSDLSIEEVIAEICSHIKE